jgi:single-strand DNA-binding protein
MTARVQLVGNLTRDPQRAKSNKGDPICRFSLAVSRPQREGANAPSYYEVACFGTLADNAYDSLKRGYRVIVEGNLDIRIVQRDDGTEKTFANVVADSVGIELRFNRGEVLPGTQGAQEKPPAVAGRGDGYKFDEEPF